MQFQKLHISLFLILSCCHGISIAQENTVQEPDSQPIEHQLQAQLDAIKRLENAPKVIPRLIANQDAFRLWTTMEHIDTIWEHGLLEASNVFKRYLGSPEKVDIVLVDTQLDMARVDRSDLQDNNLILPLTVLKMKTKNNHASSAAVLNHEVCHIWLIELADKLGIQTPEQPIALPFYGHPGVPDWLDEAIAVSCESGELALSRVEQKLSVIPFEKYLNMEHPIYTQIRQQLMGMKTQQQNVVIKVESDESEEPQLDQSIHFYYQAAWFRRFLEKHLGQRTFLALMNQLAKGQSLDNYLVAKFGVDSLDDLSSQFAEYVDDSLAE